MEVVSLVKKEKKKKSFLFEVWTNPDAGGGRSRGKSGVSRERPGGVRGEHGSSFGLKAWTHWPNLSMNKRRAQRRG